jgi:outer membrane protein
MKTKLIGLGMWGMIFLLCAMQSPARAATAQGERLTVDQAVELAIQNNLQRKMAEGEVAIAGDKAAQAKAGYKGKLTLSGGISQLNDQPDLVKLGQKLADLNNAVDNLANMSYQWAASSTSSPNPLIIGGLKQLSQGLTQKEGPDDGLTYYGINLRYELPLYTGGKLEALNRQAQANQAYTRYNLETVEQELIFTVKKAYYVVLQTRQSRETLNEAVKSMENHLREAQLYYEAGMVPQLDVMRAEVKLADLRQKQLMVNNGLETAQVYLDFVLGVDQGNRYELVDQMEYTPYGKDLEAAKQTALENRSELKAIRTKVQMAEEAVTVVKSGNKPIVALVAEGGEKTTRPFNSDDLDLSLSLVATLKLTDGGMVKNRIAEAEKVVRQAKTGEEQLTRAIKLEVEQAYRNLQNALETIAVARKVLNQAQETVRMAEVSYKEGLSTSLERIDAETGLTQAKNNYNQAVSNYQIALAQLEKAIGDGGRSSR